MSSNKLNQGWASKHRRHLLIGGPVLILLIIVALYITGGRYVSTDDAYIQAARTNISASIAGRITNVAVQDNQEVSKDDILFTIDDRDFIIAVEDAKAKLENAKLRIIALKATYLQRQADVKAANNTLIYAERELERQRKLAIQGISSQAQLDQADHALIIAKQKLHAAEQERENIKASLNNDPNIDVKDHPAVKQAQAILNRAELNLSYTIVRAPADGIVTKVEKLQVGDYINAAEPLFALVSNKDIWVEANFKETDLTYIRPGQDATITVDTYPGKVFHGKVESLSPGTGSSFSLLPPENASGNWVKVVQRLPVRININDSDHNVPLHSGLSAIVEVDTHHSRL